MEVSPTPRQMAKGLLNGVLPSRPLFLPIVFSLGAKVENVPFETFLGNPTKISSSLRQMRSHLRTDGVSCYFDPFLEVEALGAILERKTDNQSPFIHWPRPAKVGELPEGLRSAEEAARSARVPVAGEVLRRMNSLPNRDFLLMATVSGPMTLAARITQPAQKESLRAEEVSVDAQELAASVVTQIATTFLEAGADLLLIQEEILTAFSMESCDAWANLLAPAINVTRFYEALPVLQLAGERTAPEIWDMIFRQQWECVVSLPLETIASRYREGFLKNSGAMLGVALPLNAFTADEPGGNNILETLRPIVSDLRPAVITTAGDIPDTTDMKRLTQVLGEVSRAI